MLHVSMSMRRVCQIQSTLNYFENKCSALHEDGFSRRGNVAMLLAWCRRVSLVIGLLLADAAPLLTSPDGWNSTSTISWSGRRLRGGGRDQWELTLGQHNIVLFGPPGVGKGSQSERLIAKYGVCHISTGDMLRAEIKRGTTLGKQAKETISHGGLLPDRLMVRLVRKRLNHDERCQTSGWLLDGFPRTAGQALTMLSAGLIPHHVVVLNASGTTLLSRALGRWIAPHSHKLTRVSRIGLATYTVSPYPHGLALRPAGRSLRGVTAWRPGKTTTQRRCATGWSSTSATKRRPSRCSQPSCE